MYTSLPIDMWVLGNYLYMHICDYATKAYAKQPIPIMGQCYKPIANTYLLTTKG